MDPTYLSLFIFTIISILYYLFKPKLTIDILYSQGNVQPVPYENLEPTAPPADVLPEPINPIQMIGGQAQENNEEYANYTKKSYLYLVIYVLTVIVSQFFVNVSVIVEKCGGSLKDNFAAGALMTFIPWVFIFGSVSLILIIFPGFKSAFSNVIGYFTVSGQASDILNKLLVNANMQEAINSDNTTPEQKAKLQKSAEAIIKLCGNTSIMINQIVPENFKDYWSILIPLMKDEYQQNQNSADLKTLQENLLGLVITRDNIGEALWYFYTAILLISVVQYNLTKRGCISDPELMVEKHKQFVQEEENKLKQPGKNQIYAGS